MTDRQLNILAQAPMLAFNNRDWDGVRSCTTANFTWEDIAANRKIEGVEQVIEAWQAWIVAFPDIRANVLNSFACEANVVCDETIVSGTHTGPMQTPDTVIPATGKSVEVRTCRIVEIEGGKVKSIREYFDMMTMLQQLGLAG